MELKRVERVTAREVRVSIGDGPDPTRFFANGGENIECILSFMGSHCIGRATGLREFARVVTEAADAYEHHEADIRKLLTEGEKS